MTRGRLVLLGMVVALGAGSIAMWCWQEPRTRTAVRSFLPTPSGSSPIASPLGVPGRASPRPRAAITRDSTGDAAHPTAPASAADALVAEADALPPEELPRQRGLLTRALDLEPRNVDALRALGKIRLEDEAYNEAIELATRCLEVDPENDDCADVRRMALGRSGRGAEEDAEMAYAQRPDDFGRIASLAQLRVAQKRLVEARALIEEMRAVSPESPLVPTLEAVVAMASGDADGARRAFAIACHLGQEYACNEAARLQSEERRGHLRHRLAVRLPP